MDLSVILSNLTSRGFKAYFVDDKESALRLITQLISPSDSVGFGGSETVTQLNLPAILHSRGNKVFHRGLQSDTPPQQVMKDASVADWFISSANALTADGVIVNTDGRSNRVSGQIYGGGNTLIVLGINKIVPGVFDAFKRIKEIAAPLNCKRLNIDNPCVRGGDCADCSSETTICRTSVIQQRPPSGKNYYVIIINEVLGY